MIAPLTAQRPSVSTTYDSEPLTQVFSAVSNPTRLRLLLTLLDGERHVNELVALAGVSQGRVSTHLLCLSWCGFVQSERRGKYVYYRVTDQRVRQLIQIAQDLVVRHGEQLATCSVLDREGTPDRRE